MDIERASSLHRNLLQSQKKKVWFGQQTSKHFLNHCALGAEKSSLPFTLLVIVAATVAFVYFLGALLVRKSLMCSLR
jgi:hypothetical protein